MEHYKNNRIKKTNLILIFLSILLWFSSIYTLADISIYTNLENSVQRIKEIIIEDIWWTRLFDFNSWQTSTKIYMNTPQLSRTTANSLDQIHWALWVNIDWEVIFISTWALGSWWTGWSVTVSWDNLWNHTATKNINLNWHYLVDQLWDTKWIKIDWPNWNVTINSWTLTLWNFAWAWNRCVYTDSNWLLYVANCNTLWDDLWNHTATENIILWNNRISYSNTLSWWGISFSPWSNDVIFSSLSGKAWECLIVYNNQWLISSTWCNNLLWDNLWNHTATTWLRLNNNRLTNAWWSQWIRINDDWNVGINIMPDLWYSLHINWDTKIDWYMYALDAVIAWLTETENLKINWLSNSGNKCLYVNNNWEVLRASTDCNFLWWFSWDNLWDHTARNHLQMASFWIQNIWWSSINCDTTKSWSIKFSDNCFQWCNWTNRVNLWWICSTEICWNNNVWITEECDDWNIINWDWCSSLCISETPICNFHFTPTSWNTPLQVKFNWTEQSRSIYTIDFGDWETPYSNIWSFSWTTHIYKTNWIFYPQLNIKNKLDYNKKINCYSSTSTTGIIIEQNNSCWDWIIQKPNSLWIYEQCDNWLYNSITWECNTNCLYNIPECKINASINLFTWGTWISILTWAISPRANYVIKEINPSWEEKKILLLTWWTNDFTETRISELNPMIWEYTIILYSNNGIWNSCSTKINLYSNEEYACWNLHDTDQIELEENQNWLCKAGYTLTTKSFEINTGTIKDVINNRTWAKAIIFTWNIWAENPTIITYIDTGKNMVYYNWWLFWWYEYIMNTFHNKFLNKTTTILLPEQWYKYWTRSCEKNWSELKSSCFSHKKINWNCAFDMWDTVFSSKNNNIWTWDPNFQYIYKCLLTDRIQNEWIRENQTKYTRWIPSTNDRYNIQWCKELWDNIFSLNRECHWYNYWNNQPQDSCKANVILTWFSTCTWIFNAANNYYWRTQWNNNNFNTP